LVSKEEAKAPNAPETEEAKTRRGRPPKPKPSKVGEKDANNYELLGVKDNRVMLKSPTGRFGVYQDCWTSTEKTLLRPQKDEELAKSVLDTGKIHEKPAPKKEEG